MRTALYLLLLCFWVYLAYGAYRAGNLTMAAIYLLIGIALTAYRMSRRGAAS